MITATTIATDIIQDGGGEALLQGDHTHLLPRGTEELGIRLQLWSRRVEGSSLKRQTIVWSRGLGIRGAMVGLYTGGRMKTTMRLKGS